MTDKDFEIIFPFVLRKAMRRKGIKQYELAELSGLSENSISRYIKGHRIPSARDLRKIACALDCSADELIMMDEKEANDIKNTYF